MGWGYVIQGDVGEEHACYFNSSNTKQNFYKAFRVLHMKGAEPQRTHGGDPRLRLTGTETCGVIHLVHFQV